MADPVQGELDIQTQTGTTRIALNPDLGDVTAGGAGGVGDVILKDAAGTEVARLGRIQEYASPNPGPKGGGTIGTSPILVTDYTGLRIRGSDGKNLVQLGWRPSTPFTVSQATSHTLGLLLGGSQTSGSLRLVDATDRTRAVLGEYNGKDARLLIMDASGRILLEFDPTYAALYVGAKGNEGDLILRDGDGLEAVKLDSGSRYLRIGPADAPQIRLASGNAWLGGNGQDGDLLLFRDTGDNQTVDQATVHVDGAIAKARIGGAGQDGLVTMRSGDGKDRIRLDAGGGNIWLGGNGQDGDLMLFSKDGDNQTTDSASIHLNGDAGDIILRNADCAEEFDVPGPVEAGTVMVLDARGRLEPSSAPYDRRVAGIVSGAGPFKPGIVLDRRPSAGPRAPIALMGKVACKVDASHGPIAVGDLLTTSPTPGHAMRAADPARAFGAVLGKALAPLSRGTAHLPVLVSLQ